ncbi:MAG TPA: XdhC family protein [Gammaproteobacteria bacterium]|nr:XdhC family protein [Gammaproteobacteria bacterium]
MIVTDTILEQASRLKAAGEQFALVTVVRSDSPTSAKPGAKGIVRLDGTIEGWIGGGCAQPAVIKTAKQALRDGQPRLIRITPDTEGDADEGITEFGMACHSGGTLDIFIDPVTVKPTLLILGSAPAGQVLTGLAARVGFHVVVADRRIEREAFPEAAAVLDSMDGITLQPPAFVVVATQGRRDEAGLEAALATGAEYVAFISSGRKADKLREYLKERGHDPARVDAIIAPAGVPTGAVTPEEIALSVLAGVSQARRAGKGAVSAAAAARAPQPETAPEPPAQAGEEAGEAIDPVCGMSVEIADAEHVAEHGGRRYYFCCAGCRHKFEKSPDEYLERST